MENNNMEATESMAIINKMINNAKSKLADDGFLYIFWGWAVIAAAMIQYVSIKMGIDIKGWSWAIIMPLGGIFSAVYGYKQKKKQKVKSYVDNYLGYLWGAFGIGLVIILVFGEHHGIKVSYFALMILYGMATFISGGLLNFKPLVWGSLISFACAVVSTFLGDVDQLLIISIALLGSYVIPGHLLRAKFKSQNNV
jgi:predicted permease